MTASLVTKKRSLDEVCNSFLELEQNMDATIMTTSQEHLRKHATSATEVDIPYSMDTQQQHLPTSFHIIERAIVRLTLVNKLSLYVHDARSAMDSWKADNKKQKGPLEQQIRQLGNIQHVIGVMGLLPGCVALAVVAEGWSERESKKLNSWNFSTSFARNQDLMLVDDRTNQHPGLREEPLGCLSDALYASMVDMMVAIMVGIYRCPEKEAARKLETHLGKKSMNMRHLLKAIRNFYLSVDLTELQDLTSHPIDGPDAFQSIPPNPSTTLLSHRMEQLFRFLTWVMNNVRSEDGDDWRGMIFVEQTLMTLVLEDVLRLHPSLNFFKGQSLTGHNSSWLSAAMEDSHQRQIVQMFRSGAVNLLICTSVAEEGLDIAQCSMVVRFHLPPTEASYIQSRGRARRPNSLYAMFYDQDDPTDKTTMDNLRFAEQCMKAFAGDSRWRRTGPDEDFMSGTQEANEEIARSEASALMPMHGFNDVGKHVAVEMLYAYIHQLPQDGYCQLTPHLIFRSRDVHGRQEFQYKLTLPANSAIHQPILGEWETSKKKAKQSVCYTACVELRNLGEVDRGFNTVRVKGEVKEKRRANKGYNETIAIETAIDPEQLSPEMEDGAGMEDEGKLVLYLNVATISPAIESDIDTFGFLTLRELHCFMSFPLYSESGNLDVSFESGGALCITQQQFVQLKQYHLALIESMYFKTKLFTSVCREKRQDWMSSIDANISFLPAHLQSYEADIPNINNSWYLICPIKSAEGHRSMETDPLSRLNEMDIGGYGVDWQQVEKVVTRMRHLDRPGIQRYEKPDALEYGEILISPYNNAAYKLVGMRTDLDLDSEFPAVPKAEFYDASITTKEYRGKYNPKRSSEFFSTFKDYYTRHWKFTDLDDRQPLMECISFKQLSIIKQAKNLLNPFSHQLKDQDTVEELDDWNGAVHLLPELVVLYPIKYTFWKCLSYIVAISWKMEWMMKANDLRMHLFEHSQIERSIQPPDVAIIYESVTSKSCHEHCTYERLEFIGDAALKYISSLYCYFKYPLAHEGQLTQHRTMIIANKSLASAAMAMGLQRYIRTVQIGEHPWRPAGCQLLDAYWLSLGKDEEGPSWFGGRNQKASQENAQHQSKTCLVSIKQVADVVESLMGACYEHGGLPCVCAFIDRIGLLPDSADFLLKTHDPAHELTAWLKGMDAVLDPGLDGLKEFQESKARRFEHGQEIDGLESKLNYRFASSSFALEALTHCSWPHPDPPCYQRLEYLGDAVLDFMVTLYYSKSYKDSDPGQLTQLRAASVNNDKLATTAVKAEVYRYMLHFSPYLQSHIAEYIASYSGGQVDEGSPKVLGDIVESLIGAVYLDLDGDLDKTWNVWYPLLEPFYTPDNVPEHPVVFLTKYCQIHGWKLEFLSKNESNRMMTMPIETETGSSESDDEEDVIVDRRVGKRGLPSSDHCGRSFVQVQVEGIVVAEGEGPHVKTAKRQAANKAIRTAPWHLQLKT